MIGQLNSWAYKLEKVAKYTRQIKIMQIDSKPSPHLLGHSFLDADPFVTTGCPSVPRGNCGADFNPSPHFLGHSSIDGDAATLDGDVATLDGHADTLDGHAATLDGHAALSFRQCQPSTLIVQKRHSSL